MNTVKWMLVLSCVANVYTSNVPQCNEPLGMENGQITNHQISASSNSKHAHKARLHGERAWRAETESDEWIEVDFQRLVYVAGITTQGRGGGDETECVSRYQVSYSIGWEEEWEYVTDEEYEEEVFEGNHNRNSPVFSNFARPVQLRLIRIEPTDCKHRCSLRFELYGCEVSEFAQVSTTTHKPVTFPAIPDVTSRKAIVTAAVRRTEARPTPSRTTTSKLQSSTKHTLRSGDIHFPYLPLAPANGNPSTQTPFKTPKTMTMMTTVKDVVSSPTVNVSLVGAGVVGARTGMSTGSVAIVAGAAAVCVLVVFILLVVAAVCLLKRKTTSSGAETGGQVMQSIGPYEPTTPGSVSNPSIGKQVMQQMGPYEPTMPTPVLLMDKWPQGTQIMQQMGPYEPTMPGPVPTVSGSLPNGPDRDETLDCQNVNSSNNTCVSSNTVRPIKPTPKPRRYRSINNITLVNNMPDREEDEQLYAIDN